MTEPSFDFESLPTELQIEAIRKVAHRPNRVQARKDLANLWNTSNLVRKLERFRLFLNRLGFPNQFCSDSMMLAGWRPASHGRTVIE